MSRPGSPDSSLSISSLLASCSLRRSGSSSRSSAAVVYNDRLYDSASKALEAYIQDYDKSHSSPLHAGKITITRSARARPPAARRANPRLKTKPRSSRRRPAARDPDLLSLTTDDLLSYPSDGSLPFSSSSQSEQNHRRTVRRQHVPSSRKHAPLPSFLNRAPRLNLLDLQPREFPGSPQKHNRHSIHGEDSESEPTLRKRSVSSYFPRDSGVSKSYPRWMTSQKSELSVSGLTSVPDVKYPVWLKTHGLLSDSDSDAVSWSYRSLEQGRVSNTCRKLHGSSLPVKSGSLQVLLNDTHQDHEGHNSVTLTDLVCKTPTSHRSSIKKHTSVLPKTLVSEKMELANDFPRSGPSPLCNNGSPRTEEILEAERSWENIQFPLKSPIPVLCEDDTRAPQSAQMPNLIDDFLNDCLKSDGQVPVSSFSGGNHHGPVEALKHMLFNLQAFQQSIGQGKTSEHVNDVNTISQAANPQLSHFEQEMFPVNKSLQNSSGTSVLTRCELFTSYKQLPSYGSRYGGRRLRYSITAMHHLSRLKELVGDGHAQGREKTEGT